MIEGVARKRYRFGDRVRVNHEVGKNLGGRFGVVIRSGEGGAYLIFWDQSESYLENEKIRGVTDAEWWGFLQEVSL